MVMVKDLTELTLRDLWREVKEEEDWWEEISKRTLNMVKLKRNTGHWYRGVIWL